MVTVGALIGAGLGYLLLWALPAPSDPLSRLARFDAQRAATSAHRRADVPVGTAGLQQRLGSWLAPELARAGVRCERLRQDLVLAGQTFEEILGRKVLVGFGGLVFGLLSLVLLTRFGLSFPPGTGAIVALAAGVGGFFVPDYEARVRAAQRRRQFHQALSVYLRWVALQMAGQVSPQGALPQAASVGAGWPLLAISNTLESARHNGEDPWSELGHLGARIGVVQLHDLAVLIGQVANDGARVRDTLAARADSMQAEALAAIEEQTAKRSQVMIGAQLLVAMGFMVFLGYPSLQSFLAH